MKALQQAANATRKNEDEDEEYLGDLPECSNNRDYDAETHNNERTAGHKRHWDAEDSEDDVSEDFQHPTKVWPRASAGKYYQELRDG